MASTTKAENIVFITTGLATGGAEIMLYRILREIDRQQFNPFVIALLGEGKVGTQISSLNIPVYYLNLQEKSSALKSIVYFREIIKRVNPSKLQGWMYHGNLAAQIGQFFSFDKVDVFWSIHNTNPEVEKVSTRALGFLLKLLSRYPRNILYVSEASRQQHEKKGFSSYHSKVIPNGFDISRFQPSEKLRRSFRKELLLDNDVVLIGLIARFHPMKDHQTFLKAASIMCQSRTDVYFVLAGSGVNYENSQLSNCIDQLNIRDRVYLLGERHDTDCINAALDVATVSSAYAESFPLVIGEAMASGTPCVVTDIGASAEIVGNTGVVVPPRSPEKLFQGWSKILDLNFEEKVNMDILARERIIKLFSLDKVVDQYEKSWQIADVLD
jgi:glycosyltransferase involved in cell wall biosynthesis